MMFPPSIFRRMMPVKSCLLGAAALLGAVSLQADRVIRLAASDLLADAVREPLQQLAGEHSFELRIEAIGSLPAIDGLYADELDLAIIAVPQGKEVPRQAFSIQPFAYDAAVIIVNERNPMDEISLNSLGGIYGTDEELNFNSWGDLGLSGWGNRNIKPLAGVPSESIALELFRHTVLSRATMKTNVSMVQSTEIESMVAGDPASIGVLANPPVDDRVKVLMVAAHADAPGFGPTKENIHFGDYPIRLPFYIAFKPGEAAKVGPVLRALLTDQVAAALEANAFFPLPETVRKQFLIDFDFEGTSGNLP